MDSSDQSSSETEEEINARGDVLAAQLVYLKKYCGAQEKKCIRVRREIDQMKKNHLKLKTRYEEECLKNQPLDLSKGRSVTSTKHQ